MYLVQSTSQKLVDVINELLNKQQEVTMNCQDSLSKVTKYKSEKQS